MDCAWGGWIWVGKRPMSKDHTDGQIDELQRHGASEGTGCVCHSSHSGPGCAPELTGEHTGSCRKCGGAGPSVHTALKSQEAQAGPGFGCQG